MTRFRKWLAGIAVMSMIALMGGCPSPGDLPIDPTLPPSDDGGTQDTGGSGTLDPGGSDDAGPGPGNNGADPDPGGGGTDSGKVAITGRLALSSTPSGRSLFGPEPAGREIETIIGCEVVAVSQQTEQVYRGVVEGPGEFSIELPESERGNTFVLTILGPDSKPLGPVLLGVAGESGLTGLKPEGEVDLGTIEIPQNVLDAGIVIGEDADLTDAELDPDAQARLNEDGVPVGIESFGKGDEAMLDPAELALGTLDADMDGLIDMFDADSNGSGIVDDFEPGASSWPVASGLDHYPLFFMNVMAPTEEAAVYYDGSDAEIEAALIRDVVITFDVGISEDATRSITGCRLLDSPAPEYLSRADLRDGPVPPSDAPVLWSSLDYAFNLKPGGCEAFIGLDTVMSPGDTFRVEVTMSDGETYTHTRMINFIFKRIPRLVRYGNAGAMKDYDPSGNVEQGFGDQPLLFDGAQDLVLEFLPPEDEDGRPLTRLDYMFGMSVLDPEGDAIHDPIDVEATWPPMDFFTDWGAFFVTADDLTPAEDGTCSFTLPKEFFVDQVVLLDGSTRDVGSYAVGLQAFCPSANSGLGYLMMKE